MKYFSMFSGIGGFELGIKQAYEDRLCNTEQQEGLQGVQQDGDSTSTSSENGYPQAIGYSEIDKYAVQIFEKQFPNIKNYGDATKINPSELPDFDCLVGGFPCQAFSIAGKRAGFNDTRGTLFFDIARILAEKKPRLVVLENVKGLLSHDGGKTFQTILGVLTDLGYFIEWQVLNSKNFGVPQNRERVFIIGHLGGERRPKVFPLGESNPRAIKQIIAGGQGNRVYDPNGVAVTQASQAGGRGAKTGLYAISQKERRTKASLSNVANTLTSHFRGSPDGDGRPAVFDSQRIRRLTPTECERLQGFPDGWTEGLSDTQRYKTLGNAVTVNVVKEVFKKLLNQSNENKQ